jgi:hypothetical protein
MSLILQVIALKQRTFNLICGTKMRLRKICAATLVGLFGVFQGAVAQHKCGSDAYHQGIIEKDPTVKIAENELNELLKQNATALVIPGIFVSSDSTWFKRTF